MTLAWIRELAPVIIHINLPVVGEFLALLGSDDTSDGVAMLNRPQIDTDRLNTLHQFCTSTCSLLY